MSELLRTETEQDLRVELDQLRDRKWDILEELQAVEWAITAILHKIREDT